MIRRALWLFLPAFAWAQPVTVQGTFQHHVIVEEHTRATCPGPFYSGGTRQVGAGVTSVSFPSDFACPVLQFNTGTYTFQHPTVALSGTIPAGSLDPTLVTITAPAPRPAATARVSGVMRDTAGGDPHRFRMRVQMQAAAGTQCTPGQDESENITSTPDAFTMSVMAACAIQSMNIVPGSVKAANGRVTEFEAVLVSVGLAEMAHSALFGAPNWSGGLYTITVRTVYKFTAPQDKVTISRTDPAPLEAGYLRDLAADIDYALEGAEKAKLILDLIAEPAMGPRTPLDRIESAEFSKGSRTLAVEAFDVTIPEDGKVILKASLMESGVANPRTLATSAEVALAIADDYSIQHIELVQVVQDETNSVPLVANKPSFIRVFPQRAALTGPQEDVPLSVEFGLPGGAPCKGSLDGTRQSIKDSPDRTRFTVESYDFFVPADCLLEGDLDITATVNPERTVQEHDYTNNQQTIRLRLNKTRGLVVKYIPVCIQLPGLVKQCPSDGVANAGETIQKMYPLAEGALSYSRLNIPDVIWPELPTTMEARDKLFRYLERLFNQQVAAAGGLIETDQLAAWLPNGLLELGGVGGIAAPLWIAGQGRVTLNSDQSAEDLLWTQNLLAHEIGHNLGLRHAVTGGCGARDPNTDWAFPNAAIQEHGVDPAPRKFKLGTPPQSPYIRYDLMSYCGPAYAVWMSPFHYRKLFNGEFLPSSDVLASPPAASRLADGGYALISGAVSRDGRSGELDPVYGLSGTAQVNVSDPGGDYCLRFMGPDGQTASEDCFRVSFQDAESGRERETQLFSRIVALPAGAARLSLRWNGQELTAITPSASAPSVQFNAPAAGAQWAAGQQQTVRWTASDPDGGTLTSSLFYRENAQAAWIAIAADLRTPEFAIDPALLLGGANVQFRVVVSDGYRSAEAIVGPVNVVQAPAIAVNGQPVFLGEARIGESVEGFLPVSNTGSGPLVIESIGSNSARFAIPSLALPITIEAGATRRIAVHYTPEGPGADFAVFTIASNAGNQPQLTVNVSASGSNGQQPRIRVDSETVGFFRVPVGTSSSTSLEVSNPSLAALNVTWQPAGAAFRIEGPPAAFTLAPGDARRFTITFGPTALGESTGALTLTSNDSTQSALVVQLVGSAIPVAEAAAEPSFTAGSMVSAASFMGGRYAPEMFVAVFGENLASELAIAGSFLPTSLGGTRVTVRDSQGAERAAKLHFVSPTNLNFLMPAGTALGPAVVSVANASGDAASAAIQIQRVAPGLFAANSNGQGPAAATYLRVGADGQRAEGFTFTLGTPRVNDPIALGGEADQVYVSFFGTGIRGQSSVTAKIGGLDVPVLGAVAQGEFEGLDQVVVGPLPRALSGRGDVNLEISFDGITANVVTIRVQ